MAEDGLLHTTELLNTALPYVEGKAKLVLDLFVKFYELIICIQNFKTNDITACGFNNEKVDLEALLKNIKPKCNKEERVLVDKLLNIFQAKKIFEMYNSYMEVMNAMEGFNDPKDEACDNDTGNIMNNFTGFDFSTILGDNVDISSIFDQKENITEENQDHDNNIPSQDENTEDENTEDKDTDNIINEKNNKENSRSDYNNIYETLKAMIPPEQMETYENLRMLFDTPSYDDSNKSDEKSE